MGKQERLMHVLSLLRARRRMTIQELVEECGVSERTIYRDIQSLHTAKFPVYYDNGLRLMPEAILPPLQFSTEEYELVRSALRSPAVADEPAYRDRARGLLGKLERTFSENPPVGSDAASEAPIAIYPKTVDGSGEQVDIHRRLAEAIGLGRRTRITYQSLRGEATSREVDPYFVVFRGHGFYLVGMCHLRGALRLFRLQRIQSVDTLHRDAAPTALTPADVFRHSWDLYLGEPFGVELEVSGRARLVLETGRHHPSETIEALDDDRILYRVTVNSIEEIGRWVVGLGDDVRIVRPEALRTWAVERARRFCERQGGGE